jgi:hypothetical protein
VPLGWFKVITIGVIIAAATNTPTISPIKAFVPHGDTHFPAALDLDRFRRACLKNTKNSEFHWMIVTTWEKYLLNLFW